MSSAANPSLSFCRKLKKMYRTYKEEKEGGEKKKHKDPNRPRHRWDLDYELEPYEGLSPEYMEMSECSVRLMLLLGSPSFTSSLFVIYYHSTN